MTVLAYDGRILAADSLCSLGDTKMQITKLHRVPQGIVGFFGDADHGMAVVEWFVGGCIPDKYPLFRDEESCAEAVLLNGRQIYLYDSYQHVPVPVNNKFFAFGSGGEVAVAAMECGKSSIEAVEIACKIKTNCGLPVYYYNTRTDKFSYKRG